MPFHHSTISHHRTTISHHHHSTISHHRTMLILGQCCSTGKCCASSSEVQWDWSAGLFRVNRRDMERYNTIANAMTQRKRNDTTQTHTLARKAREEEERDSILREGI